MAKYYGTSYLQQRLAEEGLQVSRVRIYRDLEKHKIPATKVKRPQWQFTQEQFIEAKKFYENYYKAKKNTQ